MSDESTKMRTAADSKRMFPVSWQELHRDAKALAWRLVGLGPWRGMVAVTRGGLVPAGIIARELGIRIIDTVSVTSYSHMEQGKPTVRKPPNSDLHRVTQDQQGRWLIIDDLVDTGTTAKIVRELLPGAHFATIYAKPAGKPMVDTYVTEVSQDTWIMFPWDLDLQASRPIAGDEAR
jgi:xanthine phosphoribosyltransferase